MAQLLLPAGHHRSAGGGSRPTPLPSPEVQDPETTNIEISKYN